MHEDPVATASTPYIVDAPRDVPVHREHLGVEYITVLTTFGVEGEELAGL